MSASNATPAQPPASEGNGLGIIYWVLAGIVLVLIVIGLIAYSGAKEDQEARDKAAELTRKLEEAGLRAPRDQDIIVRSLGTDGGAVCDNPASALGRALAFDQLTNGASQVGRRPIIADPRLIQGEALIIETYCPDELEEFRDKFDDLETDDVIAD
jgi:hypothetical protein